MGTQTLDKKIDERTLVVNSFKRLRKKEVPFVCCEVPLLGRCLDLAYFLEESLVSVEFKLHNWRRALQQARDHRLGVDFAYICMPKREITNDMINEFIDAGVGLVFYQERGQWPFEEVIKAPKSYDTWSVARSELYEYIKNNQND